MTASLPIAARELRIAARSERTYNSRRNIAGLAILLFVWLYWSFGSQGGLSGNWVFFNLARAGFAYAFFAGIILTADCVSGEKREGTLGLLFLTSLRSHDIVIGNMVATSLKAFYGLVGAFPILGIGMALGGVSYSEFGRVCLTWVSTLLFSLSFSLLVSCLSKKYLAATSGALLGLVFFTIILPGVCEGLRQLAGASLPGWVLTLRLFSPVSTFDLASAQALIKQDFWWSVLAVNFLSVTFLSLACLILPWVWKDRPSRPVTWSWEKRPELIRRNARLRARLLALNPFCWLASRHSFESTKFLMFCVTIGVTAVLVARYYLTPTMGGRFPDFYGPFAAWSFACGIIHVALLFKLAALSSHRFGEDRKSGALELLLVTPFEVRQIVRGQWLAIVRQLGGPAFAAIFIHALMFWAFLTLCTLEEELQGGAPAALHAFVRMLWEGETRIRWEIFYLGASILGIGLLLVLHWIALVWVGMWIGLRAKRPIFAAWITLVIVLLPPAPVYSSILIFAHWMDLSNINSFWFRFCLILAFVLWLINPLLLIGWSRHKLRHEFRLAASDRYQRSEGLPLVRIKRLAPRLAWAAVAAFFLISLFYNVEKWRGLRAWRKLETEFAARGQILASRFTPPALVSAAHNFGAARIFEPLFDYTAASNGHPIWKNVQGRRKLLSINLTGEDRSVGRFRPRFLGTNEPYANWALNEPANLAVCANFYRATLPFAPLTGTNQPAETVLRALALFDPELNELNLASRLPQARFPLDYDAPWGYETPHRDLLENVAEILQFRAIAKLELDRNEDALADIEFTIRLADAFRMEPGFFPQYSRLKFLRGALQPVWEGLAARRWTALQLERLQKLLRIGLLQDYPRTVREETLLTVNIWNGLAEPDEWSLRRLPLGFQVGIKLYPDGWRYLNQVGLLRVCEDYLVPLVDPAAHRVYPSNMRNGAVRNSGVMMDPFFHMIAPKQEQLSVDATLNFGHAQVSLDMAIIACALEKWRLAKGTYPSSLEQLLPDYLQQSPIDAMTGQPLKYAVSENDRFLLYSVGWNGLDDHGQIATSRPNPRQQIGYQNFTEDDWVWTYRPFQNPAP